MLLRSRQLLRPQAALEEAKTALWDLTTRGKGSSRAVQPASAAARRAGADRTPAAAIAVTGSWWSTCRGWGNNNGSTEGGLPGDSPGHDSDSETHPFSDLFYVHDDGIIEVRPALFGIDDAVLASILATMLAAAMFAIIAEYGWAWVLQNRDKVPNLMIDRLPRWIGASVVQVTVWIGKFFADSGADEDLRYEPTDKHSKATPLTVGKVPKWI